MHDLEYAAASVSSASVKQMAIAQNKCYPFDPLFSLQSTKNRKQRNATANSFYFPLKSESKLSKTSYKTALQSLKVAIQRLEASTETATHVSLLQQCGNLRALSEGKLVHLQLSRSGHDRETFLGNHLVQMYGKCGSLTDALGVFDKLHHRNVHSWNIIISAYAQNGHLDGARSMFEKMVQRDAVSWTTLIAAYAQNARVEEARYMFEHMPQRDRPAWNAMIAAYAQNGHCREALHLFRVMDLEGVHPNKITFLNVFEAFIGAELLSDAKILHASMLNSDFHLDVAVWNSLVSMYGRCGSIADAKNTFDDMPERDVISWTGMMTAYTQNGFGKHALELFKRMDLEGIQPNQVTFTSAVDACTSIAAIAEGRIVHANAADSGFESDVVVASALINLYGKCGNLGDARCLFEKMPQRNVLSWSSMVSIYAQAGHTKEALEIFFRMGVDGQTPNGITFVGVLTACVHAGLMREGWSYFVSISRDYDIDLTRDHYVCMIDLLGRAGRLDEAQDLMQNMPFQPDVVAWTAYLGCCKTHLDAIRATHAAEQIFELDPENASPYMLLSSVFKSTEGAYSSGST